MIRTPLIGGITDSAQNLDGIKKYIGDSPWELLPENKYAAAKYVNFLRLDERKPGERT
jgi:hypothetical protein